MTILDGEDVDTGPGLETRHSCEFISQPEPDQPFLQGNGTYPLKSELKAAANGHHQGDFLKYPSPWCKGTEKLENKLRPQNARYPSCQAFFG